MELKAITYNYTQDGIPCNKVVGIFKSNQLKEALNDIRSFYKNDKHWECENDSYDESCDNYYLNFYNTMNGRSDYFYTSNYTVGELNF